LVTLWKARNGAVFNGVTPRVNKALLLANEVLAGAKGITDVVATGLPEK
jgi:hypothetical protein